MVVIVGVERDLIITIPMKAIPAPYLTHFHLFELDKASEVFLFG
jgi:hypothetical protein